MAPTDNPRNRREREVSRQRAQELAAQEAYRRAARRRGMVGIGVVVGVLLAVFVVVKAATGEKTATPGTTLPGQTTTSTGRSAPTVPLPTVPPGSTVTAPVGCPPADGSAPRITSFSAPPPNCLEPGLHYTARIRTTRGPIIVDLDDVTSPQAVNAFIFLARHHYYDGLPFTNVKRGAFATVADPKGTDGKPGPGFAIPSGTGQVGIVTPVTVALTPGESGATGGLIIAMPGDQVTTIPESAPRIGQIRCDFAQPVNPEDPDRTVQQEINDTATSSGGPSAVITIEGVDILNDDRVCR